MPIQPYDTLICQAYNPTKLTNEIRRTLIQYPAKPLNTPTGRVVKNASFIPPLSDYDSIPSFTQPLNIGEGNKPQWIVDGRPYMRWDRSQDTYKLTAEKDFHLLCMRVALTQALEANGLETALRYGPVPAKTFSRWITLAIAQRFNLPLEHQMTLSVITAYYYYSLHYVDGLNIEQRNMMANRVGKATMVPTETVLEISDRLPAKFQGLEGYVAAINAHTGSIRLSNLKLVDFFMLVAPSWVGLNARENVGVALEHLPTFLALAGAALDERSYRKAALSRRAETAGRAPELKQFTDQLYRTAMEYIEG